MKTIKVELSTGAGKRTVTGEPINEYWAITPHDDPLEEDPKNRWGITHIASGLRANASPTTKKRIRELWKELDEATLRTISTTSEKAISNCASFKKWARTNFYTE